MATDTSVRDALAAQLRAQYDTGAGGSGSWDDAGYDRAVELADLLMKQGITSLGQLSLVDKAYQVEGNVPIQEKYPGAYQQRVMVDEVSGQSANQWFDANGNPIQGAFVDDSTGETYVTGTVDKTGRQLQIGDQAVGYLGDYNNDGTYGNKSSEYLTGRGDENLLGWSARGDGNTSYRVVTDPNTGKLYITPGWNSSSDAADFRTAGTFLGGAALGGLGMTGQLAGLAGLSGTAGGAALSGAATGAGMNMVTTQDISADTLKAAALGGLGGYLGYTGQEYFKGLPTTDTSGVDLTGADAWDDVMRAGVDTSYTGQGMPWDLPMDNPNWQPNPADYSTPASGIPNAGQVVEITGSALPTPVNLGGAIGAGIGATIPQGQTVEVEGKRLPNEDDPTYYPGDPFVDSVESQPPSGTQPTTQNPINDGDAPTGQNDPYNDNLDPGGTGPGPVPPGSSFLDWIKANPKLAQVLLGSVLGKIGGGGGGSPTTPGAGGPGTGPQAGMTATPALSLGRRYVPPPPGYRPGFDPEHRYFTGIGTTGGLTGTVPGTVPNGQMTIPQTPTGPQTT